MTPLSAGRFFSVSTDHLRPLFVIAPGIVIGAGVTFMLHALSISDVIPLSAVFLFLLALLFVTPTLVVRSLKEYWLALFILEFPFFLKKVLFKEAFGLDPTSSYNVLDDLGLPPGVLPAPVVHLSDLLFLVLLAQWLIRLAHREERLHIPGLFWLASAYVAWSGLSILVSPVKAFAILEVANRCKLLVIFLYFANNLTSRKEVRRVVGLLIVGVAIQGALASYQFAAQDISSPFGKLLGIWNPSELTNTMTPVKNSTTSDEKPHYTVSGTNDSDLVRATGSVGSPNMQAQYFVLLMPLTFAMFCAASTLLSKAWYGLAFLLGTCGLLATFSRGGFAGFGVSMIVLLLLATYRRLLPGKMLALALVGVISASPWAYAHLTTRPHYYDARFELWEVVIPMVQDHPILGVGANNSVVVGVDYPDPWKVFRGIPFHNFYLTTASEIGLVGLGLFLFTFAWAAWAAFRTFRVQDPDSLLNWLSVGIPATLVGVGVHLSADQLAGEVNALLIWITAGMAMALTFLRQRDDHDAVVPSIGRRFQPEAP